MRSNKLIIFLCLSILIVLWINLIKNSVKKYPKDKFQSKEINTNKTQINDSLMLIKRLLGNKIITKSISLQLMTTVQTRPV